MDKKKNTINYFTVRVLIFMSILPTSINSTYRVPNAAERRYGSVPYLGQIYYLYPVFKGPSCSSYSHVYQKAGEEQFRCAYKLWHLLLQYSHQASTGLRWDGPAQTTGLAGYKCRPIVCLMKWCNNAQQKTPDNFLSR
jgi:hypothetical protein